MKRHRAEIRAHPGFRECMVVNGEKLTDWLAGDYAQKARRFELAKDAVLAELRARSIEPPTPDRVDKIVRSGLHQTEKILAEQIAGRLPADVRARLLSLVAVADTDVDDADPSVLAIRRVTKGRNAADLSRRRVEMLGTTRSPEAKCRRAGASNAP